MSVELKPVFGISISKYMAETHRCYAISLAMLIGTTRAVDDIADPFPA